MASYDLEQSWASLNIFDLSHNGRVSSALLDSSYASVDYDEQLPQNILLQESADFVIPELPEGELLTIRILATWGDPYYVGLNGIEVFADNGEKINLRNAVVNAIPRDVASSAPEFAKDPRKLENLFDGIYRTKDDTHLWLAPFRHEKGNTIEIRFPEKIRLAMLRIWNYNKSRIHSARGVRYVELLLDDCCIFRGEITRASAVDNELGEMILFTMNEDILNAILCNDDAFAGCSATDGCASGDANTRDSATGYGSLTSYSTKVTEAAPATSFTQTAVKAAPTGRAGTANLLVTGKEFRFEFTGTWGDSEFLGITGIELIQENDQSLTIDEDMLTSTTTSSETTSSLKTIFDGRNQTMDASHMWLCHLQPSTATSHVNICIKLVEAVSIKSMRFWNYNASLEWTYSGVQRMNVFVDGKLLLANFLVRKAPGNATLNFGQTISLSPSFHLCNARTPVQNNEKTRPRSSSLPRLYRPIRKPAACGFLFQFQLLSTWGDQYYIGLNGIELYDENDRLIKTDPKDVAAFPDSVSSCLPESSNDVRKCDKLVDGCNDTFNPDHMWLSPIYPGTLNRIYFMFDLPKLVSKIRIWNYSKTASSGTKDLIILVDDVMLYCGKIAQSTASQVAYCVVSLAENAAPGSA